MSYAIHGEPYATKLSMNRPPHASDRHPKIANVFFQTRGISETIVKPRRTWLQIVS